MYLTESATNRLIIYMSNNNYNNNKEIIPKISFM